MVSSHLETYEIYLITVQEYSWPSTSYIISNLLEEHHLIMSAERVLVAQVLVISVCQLETYEMRQLKEYSWPTTGYIISNLLEEHHLITSAERVLVAQVLFICYVVIWKRMRYICSVQEYSWPSSSYIISNLLEEHHLITSAEIVLVAQVRAISVCQLETYEMHYVS